jgi:7-carboxy-7-deazaguanine synthase
MTYSVKEMFLTLQGEGAQTGRAALFIRFAGCNLWSGREGDRKKAVCTFCDTDFVGTDGQGGAKFKSARDLSDAASALWQCREERTRYVVLTGGEPLMQVDEALVEALHSAGFEVAIETNGTLPAVVGLDWICVSPKANANLVQTSGNELKLVYPQRENTPADFSHLEFDNFFLQPMDGPSLEANTKAAIAYCLEHSQWRLCIQTHKVIGID